LFETKGERSFLFSKGKCHMTVTMNAGAVFAGAQLTGTLALRNDSNKTITQVKGRLLTCMHHQLLRRSYTVKSDTFVLCAQPVAAGQTFETQFQFVVPHDSSLAGSMYLQSGVLLFEHFLAIVARASFAKDLEVLVPLYVSPTGQLQALPTPVVPMLQPIESPQTAQTAQAAQPMSASPAYDTQQSFGSGAVHAPDGAPPQQFGDQESIQ
jgi:hypothetical protein